MNATAWFLAGLILLPAASTGAACTQHTVFETSMQSAKRYTDPIRDVSVTVAATAPSGAQRRVDAFWDGGDAWRVRLSPDEPGQWKWRSECSDKNNTGLHGKSGSFTCSAYAGSNPLYRHGPIRLSNDRTHFEHADGTPFLWLADTAWNGVIKAKSADWDRYLVRRRAQGFSAVQFVGTQFRGLAEDDRGEKAYSERDRISINVAFFQRLDPKVAAINRNGLVASPVMLWAIGQDDPGNLPDDQAILLARYMRARWGEYQVIWTLGGDGNYKGEKAERWKRIGRAVFGEDGNRLATMHPGGLQWVGDEFRNEPWFNFIGYQSGHGDSSDSLKWLTSGPPAKEHARKPVCPVINLEPNYEAILAYQSRKPFDARKVRRALYWSLLVSPTAGVTYGHHGIWSWSQKREAPLNHPNSGEAPLWHEAVGSEGAESVSHLASLFRSLPWWQLRPCPDILSAQRTRPEEFIAAAGSDDGKLLLAYLPEGGVVQLRRGAVEPGSAVRWFDPRTGKWTDAGKAGAEARFATPGEGDWVLCIRARL